MWKNFFLKNRHFLDFLSIDNSETWRGYVLAVALSYKNGLELEFEKKNFFFFKIFLSIKKPTITIKYLNHDFARKKIEKNFFFSNWSSGPF